MIRTGDRWTLRTLEWIPRGAKRPREAADQWANVFVARMDQLDSQLVTSKDLDLADVAAALQYQHRG
ncbi:unnamed protein product [Strongylus vulgaris]|uniref:Uncharacterized protein n=1 Tax=Strongylus vulgaris TaxID=40348 RepID=A0A3P7J395_STRVU|nr:unnamed protein product [Strongylus vulgaris]